MTTLILMTPRVHRQPENPLRRRNDLVALQTAVYETLIRSLRKIDPRLHHIFLVRVLTILLDLDDLDTLPLITLAQMLFGLLDSSEARALLQIQNVLCHMTLVLEGSC